jgi:uncharacterized protein (TIGR02757 family)
MGMNIKTATGLALNPAELKSFLDEQVDRYNVRAFIELDPISIPHLFTKKEDIEIAGLLTATISWGNRKAIVTNAHRMMALFDHQPFDFVMNHSTSELKRMQSFVHRTFNAQDLKQFVISLRNIYLNAGGLETVFTKGMKGQSNTALAISDFKKEFFAEASSARTLKHVSDPMQGSSAKRLNMYLRWMVRKDNRGVDFGIWKNISPSCLSVPLDIHSGNTARKLGVLARKQNDWQAVVELDTALRNFDAQDPVKYDFALFGLGVMEKF